MTCHDAFESLSAYLDDELDLKMRSLVEEHLLRCDDCRTALEELRQVKLAFGSLPELEPPHSLHQKVMAAVKPRRPFAQPAWFRRIGLIAAACLVLMLASSAGFLAGRFGFGLKSMAPASPRDSNESYYEGYDGLSGVEMFSAQGDPNFASDSMPESGDGMLKSPLSSENLDTRNALFDDIERKLIRRADLNLEVTTGQVDALSQQAMHVVKKYMGYIESSSLSAGQSKNRRPVFYMSARIPSDSLDQAIGEISALGHVESTDTSVQDVTERYYDLAARIKSKEVQEERLLQILGNASTVGELLQVEGELARVRSDVESMTGQKNVLEKSSAMSFISLSMKEEGTFRAGPSPWREVLDVFVNSWRNLTVFIAGIAPGAIVLAALFFAARWAFIKMKN